MARSTREIVSNLLFLPIVIFLWILLIQKRKKIKEVNLPTKILGRRTKNKEL